ncbi:MAG: hypothetical protein GTO45_13395 [Candidatus Aminicenantes bacterium]|nr:hypothetical protein [Candidatus Aminicenantes bacterium]NIM79773.1 hypothetical protein [Candidatus Aminicenantes bacterium]NIN19101.1 hypothetical protein [Candidatus Aminicenantes bacterium]NIN43003.1 hypothetical protein [Candidatus Aminicenantes bacterium]NIN85746.1 hypothetical protein [Candidatus Aminicenantes bacterium]
MKRLLVFGFVVLWGLALIYDSDARLPEIKTFSLAVQRPNFQSLAMPLYFVPNKGQMHEEAQFYARTPGYTLWLTKKGLVFDRVHTPASGHPSQEGTAKRDVARLVFPGAGRNPGIVPLAMTGHKVNYFKGNDQSKWLTNIKTSKAVLYKNLYPNIELKLYGNEKQIEYDWMVKPGGDPDNIRFQYQNVKGTRIDENGDLIIETQWGEFTHKRPVSYQVVKGKKVAVTVDFKKIKANMYGFQVGHYDTTLELIIDPVVMAYSTYLGGSGDDRGFGLAVDSSGSAYVTGDTYSTDFPTEDAYQNTSGGDREAFVTKFSPSGDSLVYSTYLGGSGVDSGEGIQVESKGQAYVVGLTSSTDFPTQSAYQNTYGGGDRDVFVTVLSSSGSSLDYSTYLGGSGDDNGYAIALDSSKNIYVTGRTTSTDFPTENPYSDTFAGGNRDAFVSKIDSSGSSLAYSTYLGGNGIDTGYGIAVNGSSAFVVGRTSSTNFPRHNDYQNAHGGGTYDVFVTKLSSSGNNLIYSTYLGGNGNDSGYGIAVDSSGSAYVTGDTYSTDFPTENAYQDTSGGGEKDAFLTRFSTSGTTLEYSTYLGGSESDAAAHVTLNSSGYACIVGYTTSSDYPLKRAYQSTFNGDRDVFVSMLSPNGGSLSFSTYLGGGNLDHGRGIAMDSSGNIYAAGYTESTDFPDENAYQDTINGDVDAFVGKFSTYQFGTICGGVDNCDLTWVTGGNADWFEQTADYYYDDDAVQSGAISHSQSTYIQTTVIGPGQLSFWWKVSSSYSDYLKFYIDGELKNSISGTYSYSTWHQRTYTISEGTHTLKWSYEKNAYYTYGSDCGWVDKVEYTPDLAIVLNRSQLTFGVIAGSTPGDQTFSITNNSPNPLNWTVSTDKNWLSCSPTSGTDDAVVTVSVDAAGLSAGTHMGTITVSAANASNSPQTISVTLNKYYAGQSSIPFGNYETPTNNSTIMSSVPFTGWVLDDLGVQSVKLYRQSGSSLVYIGDAVFVEGARPDVEQAYPDYPNNYKAGWGYMMLTNFLPNGGNGTFTIKAIATDVEGHQVTLGSKIVTVDNASAVKPFGAIDTPTQGGTASGSDFINWGWVLTPQPNSIPADGSTIDVWVDGVNIGHPTYNVYRPDIAALFPGYANSNGAIGYFYLDTTAYENGVHTIQWTARDSAGNSDGIGSRYFMIQNSSQRSAPSTESMAQGIGVVGDIDVDALAPVGIVKGYENNVGAGIKRIYPDRKGNIKVEIRETERVEFHFSRGSQLSGWMKVGDQYRALPIGSYLDTTKGVFCWQAGPGFVGKYSLVFVEKDEQGRMKRRNILVNILPKF